MNKKYLLQIIKEEIEEATSSKRLPAYSDAVGVSKNTISDPRRAEQGIPDTARLSKFTPQKQTDPKALAAEILRALSDIVPEYDIKVDKATIRAIVGKVAAALLGAKVEEARLQRRNQIAESIHSVLRERLLTK